MPRLESIVGYRFFALGISEDKAKIISMYSQPLAGLGFCKGAGVFAVAVADVNAKAELVLGATFERVFPDCAGNPFFRKFLPKNIPLDGEAAIGRFQLKLDARFGLAGIAEQDPCFIGNGLDFQPGAIGPDQRRFKIFCQRVIFVDEGSQAQRIGARHRRDGAWVSVSVVIFDAVPWPGRRCRHCGWRR